MRVEVSSEWGHARWRRDAPGAARLLYLLGAVLVVAAGAILWARHGPAVFSDYAAAALAWCF